jgi:hypothetical protein
MIHFNFVQMSSSTHSLAQILYFYCLNQTPGQLKHFVERGTFWGQNVNI